VHQNGGLCLAVKTFLLLKLHSLGGTTIHITLSNMQGRRDDAGTVLQSKTPGQPL